MQDEMVTVNPSVVLRDEFDDWAILFDPDTGEAYGVNPMGVHVWKLLDGRHSTGDIVEELKKEYDNVPENVNEMIDDFVKVLFRKGLASTANPES